MKETMLIYTTYLEKFQMLTNEQFGLLVRLLLAYQATDEIPEIDDALVSMAFDVIKVDLDQNNDKYQETIDKRKEAGRKAAEKRWGKDEIANDSNAINRIPNVTNASNNSNVKNRMRNIANMHDSVSVSVSVSDYIKKNTSKEVLKEKRFAPPSLDEVTQYCNERENGIDPQRFIDFYESKGWMIGKNKMKDWKAAVRSWESRDKPSAKESKPLTWGTMIYDPAEEQHPPRFGFPAEWFRGNTLITESVRNVIHPKDTSKGIYEAFEVKVPELINLFELRRSYYEQHNSE